MKIDQKMNNWANVHRDVYNVKGKQIDLMKIPGSL